MTCYVKGCREQAMLSRYFCPEHNERWLESPERARASALDMVTHTLTMLSDFARRIELEQSNGG